MIIDPVMDFDMSSGKTSNTHNDAILSYCELKQLTVDYILETHVHADHLTGANYLKSKLPNAPKTGPLTRPHQVAKLLHQPGSR